MSVWPIYLVRRGESRQEEWRGWRGEEEKRNNLRAWSPLMVGEAGGDIRLIPK